MPKKKKRMLGDLEFLLLSIVWRKGKATVKEVKDSLPRSKPLAYTTVSATMRNLEWKGYLRHEVDDRTYVFSPAMSWDRVVQSMLHYPAKQLFDGSAELLMVSFLEKKKLNLKKIAKLKELIAAKEKELEK